MNNPRQRNGHDCGVFVMVFAAYIASDKDINTNQEEMPYWRQLTALCAFCEKENYDLLNFLL